MTIQLLLSTLSLLTATQAHAVLRTGDILGARIVSHQVAGRRPELCSVPVHIPGADYAAKDEKNEAALCGWEIENNVAACPKLTSTNPGIYFYTPPAGMTVAELTAQNCAVKAAKRVGKYKLSTSCSYSPSLLAYYHVSRALGNIGNVPTAVLRTLDLSRHRVMGDNAFQSLRNKPQETIYKKWEILRNSLRLGQSAPDANLLFTDGFDQSYGALQRHVGGDKLYREFYNGGVDEERIRIFAARNPIYHALLASKLKPGRDFTTENVQLMQQIKDMSEFILIDTILGQQDRLGNIAYKEKMFYKASSGGLSKLEKADELAEVPAESQASAVKVKEMFLLDNDCGVAKSHLIKKHKLLDPISHMSPKTYKYLLSFAKVVESGATRDMFIRGMNFTEWDYRTVSKNLREAVQLLQENCRRGRLKLDLDLDAHFSGRALPTQYDCGN